MSRESAAKIGIEAYQGLTAFGDARATCQALLDNKVALKPTPVLGIDGGDLVPLAWSDGYDETLPPRWKSKLEALASQIPEAPWGSAGYPVYVTSSNYDVGSLYTYKATGNEDYLKIGTPAHTLSLLKRMFNWGPNAVALSHACVTANIGIEMASRNLRLGLAKKALVFSFDFISPFVAGGFHGLKILNEYMPAPYADREIGSIGLGDGAGFAVLSFEPQDFNIHDSFLYNEMFHFTSNDPSGSGFKEITRSIESVFGVSNMWIKGHGTGTLEAGKMEACHLNEACPDAPLVSWKGSIGHTLGSCGIVELAIALEAIKQGRSPGTVGTTGPTMADNVATEPFNLNNLDAVALLSNAFGGAHAACVVSHA